MIVLSISLFSFFLMSLSIQILLFGATFSYDMISMLLKF